MVRWLPCSCGSVGVSTRCARPPRCSGPADDTPPVPQLGWQLWALRPGLDGASRPSTTLTRRRPTAGFRDGAPDRNRWGRQSRPFTSPPPAAHPAPGRAPGSSRTATSRPWPMASGRRSGNWRPRRRTSRARSSRRRSPTWSATRPRRRVRGRTCSSGGGASWTIGKPALPASARGCRRPPGGPNDSMPRGSRPRATPRGPCARNAGPGGSRANGSGRQPAVAWVSSTSHATTALGRPPAPLDAILVAGDRDALHRDHVVVPRRPSSPCSRRARLRGWLARTVVPSAPGAGKEPRSERRLRRRGGRRPRPDLEMRSGLHPEAVKGDGHGMGGEPLPLRRRTRPA